MEIHIGSASLDVADDELAALEALLSGDERARAAAYRSALDGRRFVAGRGLLRQAVARHCGGAPAAVGFVGERHTKPRLVLVEGRHRWQFSFTRSDRRAMWVLSENREVGIDIERVAEIPHLDAVAKTAFSPREHASWLAMPENDRLQAFYDLWTRKEALGKAEGHGMTPGLHEVEAPVTPIPTGSVHPFGRWLLSRLEPGPGYVGHVMVQSLAGDPSWHGVSDEPEGVGSVRRTFR